MKTNKLICIVGPSGCGKDTLANELQKIAGLVPVRSYTDRPKRNPSENTHTFLTKAQYDTLENIVAQTTFNGHRYCTTETLLLKSDTYVVDYAGLLNLINDKYFGDKLFIVYLYGSEELCYRRMLQRGDSKDSALQRINHDSIAGFQEVPPLADLILSAKSSPENNAIKILNALLTGEK